jgi:hypothetical protein
VESVDGIDRITHCHYFHVVVTVPKDLRGLLRSNQCDGYGVLMSATIQAIIELASDSQYVGGTVGVMAVLHTWTRQMELHPHVHCLVTGGGVSGEQWLPGRPNFLVPVKALGKLVRGKVRAALHRKRPDLDVPSSVWCTPWVTHITHWGEGETAVLDYLARYVFRTAITNRRIIAIDDEGVTFRYKSHDAQEADGGGGPWRTCRLTGPEFIRRFLQHVLPKGFHKVRYAGLWHASKRDIAARVRIMLQLAKPASKIPINPSTALTTPPATNVPMEGAIRCCVLLWGIL